MCECKTGGCAVSKNLSSVIKWTFVGFITVIVCVLAIVSTINTHNNQIIADLENQAATMRKDIDKLMQEKLTSIKHN